MLLEINCVGVFVVLGAECRQRVHQLPARVRSGAGQPGRHRRHLQHPAQPVRAWLLLQLQPPRGSSAPRQSSGNHHQVINCTQCSKPWNACHDHG